MKKNLLNVVLMACMAFEPAVTHAQDWKDIAGTALGVGIALFGSKKSKKADTEKGTEASIEPSANEVTQRSTAFRIVTNHPDFTVKVTRCKASGKRCVLDMVFLNEGTGDVEFTLDGYNGIVYDDEGNIYEGDSGNSKIRVALGDLNRYFGEMPDESVTRVLPAGIPIKARVLISGVPETATTFLRMHINTICGAWSIGRNRPVLTLYNVPISRDGDE